MKTCGECKWWKKVEEYPWGICLVPLPWWLREYHSPSILPWDDWKCDYWEQKEPGVIEGCPGEVLNIKAMGWGEAARLVKEGKAVYIGRDCVSAGLKGVGWGNPFPLRKEGNRRRVIELYEEWVRGNKELMGRLGELVGKDLLCWCAPLPCHGDVLVGLVREKFKG